MNTKNNQMNQKIIKLVFFTALAIGAAAAVKQQTPHLTTHGVEQRDRRCPLHFDDQKIVFYPHESDCTRYYLCAENGTLVELQCPNTLEFDADFSICSWPNNSCKVNNSSDTNDEIKTRVGQSGQNNNNNRPHPHPRCASAKDGYLFPNYANNCKSFFKCHAGYAHPISCGQGLLFNEQTNYCDWEYNVKCKKPENGQGNDNNGSGNNGYYQAPNCASVVDGTMFANHQSGCKAFYICHHGKYVESRCDGQLLFNERIRACDWPQNVKCVCRNQCYGNSNFNPGQTTTPPTEGPENYPPIVEHHPSNGNGNCNNNNNYDNVKVPLCPLQPCPPENCVLQACVPHNQYYKKSQ